MLHFTGKAKRVWLSLTKTDKIIVFIPQYRCKMLMNQDVEETSRIESIPSFAYSVFDGKWTHILSESLPDGKYYDTFPVVKCKKSDLLV